MVDNPANQANVNTTDINDSFNNMSELAAQRERDAELNEIEANRLEVEVDRLRDIAKQRREEANNHRKAADELANPKRKASAKGDK